jgi:hypothetical protein
MSRRKWNSAEGITRVKLLAGKLAQAVELPRDSVAGPRDLFGRATLVPASEESLRWLGAVLVEVAEGRRIEEALHEPRQRGRPSTFRDKALRYWTFRAKGKTHADAARAAGSRPSTMKRHARRYRMAAAMLTGFHDLLGE